MRPYADVHPSRVLSLPAPAGRTRTAWRCAGLALTLMVTLALAGCGGGGSGNPGGNPTPPPAGISDTQTLPTARAVLDALRAAYFLANDVQNLIVFAPVLLTRGDLGENCDQGGSLQTRVLRPQGDAAGPLLRQQFSNCRSGGLTLQGVVEISYSQRTTDASTQPWAGSVRFSDYVIESTRQRRAYNGLAVAEGSLTGPGGSVQPLTLQLTDFRLQDTPDTLQRGVVSSTRSFRLQRASAIGAPYSLQGDWLQEASGLRVDLVFAAGSQLPLLEDIASAPATGSIRWTDSTTPSFNGSFSVSPATGTGLRVALDLGADGSVDRDAVLDRYQQIGFSL